MNLSQPVYNPSCSDALDGRLSLASTQAVDIGAAVQKQYNYRRSPRKVYENYPSKQSRVLGAIMIVSGILCIVCNAVSIGLVFKTLSVTFDGSFLGQGVYGGIWFILTGSFGIVAASMKTPCQVVTFMVLSILGAVQSLGMLIFAGHTASQVFTSGNYPNYGCVIYMYNNYAIKEIFDEVKIAKAAMSSTCHTIMIMETLQAILAVVVGILCIWGSAIGCKVACCCKGNDQERGQSRSEEYQMQHDTLALLENQPMD